MIHHDLATGMVPHLNETEMGAWFDDPEDHTQLHHLVLARSNRLIDDVLAADEVVIGAPMWNFSIPSNLKAWIDHVVRAGRTIEFSPSGATGLVTAQQAVVMVSSGNDYREGSPYEQANMVESYLGLVLGFIGIADVRFVHADHQGPSWPDSKVVLDQAIDEAVALAGEQPMV